MVEAPKLEWPTGEPLFEVHLRAISEAFSGNGVQSPNDMEVTAGPNQMEIVVGNGTAVYNGTEYNLNSATVLTISEADATYTRYDTVYYSTNSNEPQVRTGSARENATPPDLRNQEILLAIVEVPVNATNIGDSEIQNWRTLVEGASFSGDHDELTNISPDDHHTRYNDTEALEAVNNDPDHGSSAAHNYFSGQHGDLLNVGADDHHPQAHAHDGDDGSGLVDHSDLINVGSDDHHEQYTDSDAVSAINDDDNHGTTASHNYYSDSDAIAAINSDSDHGSSASHDYTTSVSDLSDLDVGEIITGTYAGIPSAGTANRWYFTTDKNGIYYDDGSQWIAIALHPSEITSGELAFNPATQSDLNSHTNATDAHHSQEHDNGDHSTNYLAQSTFSTHIGKSDIHHDQQHDNTDHSTNYTAQTTFNAHATNSQAHDPDQSDKYAESGSYEMDAADFAGKDGQDGQVLVTDGTSASWGSPTDAQAVGSDVVLDRSSTFVAVNTNAQQVTITLPTASMAQGREITFKDTTRNASSNTLTVQTQGTETIEDEGFIEITNDGASVTISCTGTEWYVTDYYDGSTF